jgi:hypothetical protein
MALNVVVISSAGKPIFSRYFDDESAVTTAGLVQAMASFAEDSGSPIRSIKTAVSDVTFMKRGSLYLLAISTSSAAGDPAPSAAYSPIYLECMLEYVYSQIVFTLTSKVQAIFKKSSNYDLRPMLGASCDIVMRGLLDRGETSGAFLTSSFAALPLPPVHRNSCTHVLQSLGAHVPNTLFSVLMSKQKLVSLVQPKNMEHQIDGPDLQLLSNFVATQSQTLMASESWFPICLPRFNPSGFIYCYTCCLHDPTELFLLLLSTENTPEQFHMFQNARAAVVHALGLKSRTAGRIIHQHSFEDTRDSSLKAPATTVTNRDTDADRSTEDAVAMSGEDEEAAKTAPLIEAILSATSNQQSHLVNNYSSVASALHFLYRTSTPVGLTGGVLTQTLSPAMQFPFVDAQSKARVWGMYQKLSVRLRSSSGEEGEDSDSFLWGETYPNQVDHASAQFGAQDVSFAPAQDYFLKPAPPNSVVWIDDLGEIFVAITGVGWELYAVLPSIVDGEEAVERVRRLRRKIAGDEETLFVKNPGVYA